MSCGNRSLKSMNILLRRFVITVECEATE